MKDEAVAVSVVVVNFNGGDRTLQCLQALAKQPYPLREILVIDNGSTDGSPGRILYKHPGVRVIELGRNLGLPAARNVGLREATSSLVLSIDSDIYVDEACIERLVKTAQERGAAVVCPRIVFMPECEMIQCDGAEAHFIGTMALRHGATPVDMVPAATTEVSAAPGGCLLLDREKALGAGGFDEMYFFYFEDLEFSLRMRALGHAIVCDSSAVVHHDPSTGTAGLSYRTGGSYPARRAYLTIRHRWITLIVHYRLRTLIVLAPALAAYEAASLAFTTFRGWLPEWARALRWLVSARSELRERRRVMASRRSRDDRDLLRGGELPLAPGLVASLIPSLAVFSFGVLLDGYWRIARRWVG